MPRTINEGFLTLHRRITPSRFEAGKATSHKTSIESRLERDFNLTRLFYTGSANNGTSISRRSDVDFFASIPREKLNGQSVLSLRQVKNSLADRFPFTRVYVDAPAVILDFGSGDWDKAEVIPSDHIGQKDGRNVYEIPDGKNGWMRSGPMAHNAYVSHHNNRLGKKLRPLIRFVKAWKYYCNVPITSFYLELRATKWMEQERSIVYATDLCSILRKLDDANLPAVQDPMGISGYIHACPTDATRREALSKLHTARVRSQKARTAETNGHIRTAFEWWDKVFAGHFPSYYL